MLPEVFGKLVTVDKPKTALQSRDSSIPMFSSDESDDDDGPEIQHRPHKSRETSLPSITVKSQESTRPRKRSRVKFEQDSDAASEIDGLTHGISNTSIASEQAHELRMEELRLKRQELESADNEKARLAELRRLEIEERLQAELIKERQRLAEASRVREQGKLELIAKLMTLITGLDEVGEGSNQSQEISMSRL